MPNIYRAILLCILICVLSLTGAEKEPVPTPAPVQPEENPITVDAATIKKAEAAADAYLQQAAVKPDPEAELALAEIEVMLLECRAYLDAKDALKAGEKYLESINKRKKIPDAQRPILGTRLKKADLSLLKLSRELLGNAAFDLGDPPGDQPTKETVEPPPADSTPAPK